jgi:hypothetical protein
MDEIAIRGRPFPPGVSGNPNGRPVGSRTAFSHVFLRDLAESWAEHGKGKTRKPLKYIYKLYIQPRCRGKRCN